MTNHFLFLACLLVAVAPVWAGSSPRSHVPAPVVPPAAAYQAAAVEDAMKDLENLEHYVIQERATLEEVNASRPDLLEGLNLRDLNAPNPTEAGPLGVPSLVWGVIGGLLGCCLLGGVAVLVVYLVTDSKQEAKKAFLGCLLGWLITGAISFFLRAAGYVNF